MSEPRERGTGKRQKEKKNKPEKRGHGAGMLVAKDISLSSAGIDAMTHWAATVPAETQKKPVCPAQKKGKREGER